MNPADQGTARLVRAYRGQDSENQLPKCSVQEHWEGFGLADFWLTCSTFPRLGGRNLGGERRLQGHLLPA